VGVQRSQSSIKRGQSAAYVVQVSTVGGSASKVSVSLTAQPSSQKPEFTSGCAKGDGTASCTLSSVTVKAPATLHAQIAVASNASSVSSVKLTATASVVTTAKWTPPAADETVSVTSASPTASSKAASSAGASPENVNLPPVPLGPIPDLNGESSKLIGPGSAAGLFPFITPSATQQPTAGSHPQAGEQNIDPISNSAALPAGTPVLTAQVAGLIALGLAIILTVTRLSLRKWFPLKRTK
jgi:hypothetical protein